MSLNKNVNPPLLRDLQEMGIVSKETTPKIAYALVMESLQASGRLTSDAIPQIIGPFRTATETFSGDTTAATQTLLNSVLGVNFCVAFPADGTVALTMSILALDTDFSITDGTTLTYLVDQTGKNILINYSY